MRGGSPVLAVCGTRPEIIKLAPILAALRQRGIPVVLALTGQHRDLAPMALAEMGLVADVDLALASPGASPPLQLSAMLAALAPLFARHRPSLAIVQGDTVSTAAGALAAAYAGVPLAHVEAGLRTGDRHEPHPEEMHRLLVSALTELHFAPTEQAAQALRREGVAEARIHITGNSGIDALHATMGRLTDDPARGEALAARYPFAHSPARPLVLATVHRRVNIGARLMSITAALARLVAFSEAEVVLPLHPNPQVQCLLRDRLGMLQGMHLIPPVDHATMVWLMQRSRLLLTDSGGLQEEAPYLGLRTLVLRAATERREALATGAAELVELTADSIVAAVRRTLARAPLQPLSPFGDGHAGTRIAAIIEDWMAGPAAAARMPSGSAG